MDNKQQIKKETIEAPAASPSPRSRTRSSLSTGAIALLVGIASSCLLWPVLVRLGIEPTVAVPVLAGWPVVVWGLVTGLRSLLRLRGDRDRRAATTQTETSAPRDVATDAEERAGRGERGWIVELVARSDRRAAPTTIRVIVERSAREGGSPWVRGSHALVRRGLPPRSGALPDAVAERLASWLDGEVPWARLEGEWATPAPDAPRGLAVSLELARFGDGELLHARLEESVEASPRDARAYWVHRALAQLLDLGAKAPWLQIDVRGREVRWSATRPSEPGFRPNVGGISFWAGPDEREPDEIVVVLSAARSEDGSTPAFPQPIARRAGFVVALPARGAAGTSALDLDRAAPKRPGASVEHRGAWARIEGDSVTFWLPTVVGVHAALVHRALGVGTEPSSRV
ncbi:MAG: hypothetical protein IT379_26095 [Deltaproteobacteria bacterium]|nr:hypothetical protein [Deltaproteobacteria bacterium]